MLTTVAAAVFLGILAQVLAERWKLPAILPLLLFGIAAGPDALGILHPEALGDLFRELIHIGVAVILFEGGLSLHLADLKRVGRTVGHLLTLGLVVTWLASALLAHLVLAMPWTTASLFGAIVTVTGPTVVVPLLRHMIAPRPIKTVLVSEGLIIDPIGAVLAYLVLQWIERAGIPFEEMLGDLFTLAATGVVVGFAFGKMGDVFAKRRLASRELRNVTVLALVLMCFLAAERTAPESGILAVVVMGVTMSAASIPDLEPLRAFKEQLTILLISVLFVLLAGQLDLRAILDLGWPGVAVAVGMIVLVRPLSVALAVWPGQMDFRGRTVLAMLAPRGIVAAAVASLAARELTRYGIAGGTALEGLVYLVIVVTGLWATVMAVLLPRWLGYLDDPSRRLAVLVGANALSRGMGRVLQQEGRQVTVVDSARWKLEELRREGLGIVRGDARAASTYERAGVERDTQVLLLTTNDELNVLASELVHTEFGVEHPVAALQNPSPEFGTERRAWLDLLGGGAVDLPGWLEKLKTGRGGFLTLDVEDEEVQDLVADLLETRAEDLVLLWGWDAGASPRYRMERPELPGFRRITVLAAGEVRNELSARAVGPPGEAVAEADSEAPR
jgi:NhaP-type Na+/H+ or K+/H+ antiporter